MDIKKKFVLRSSIITAFPIIMIIPWLGNIVYITPGLFIIKILNIFGITYSISGLGEFGLFPDLKGFMILIPFWLIVGYLNGLVVYKIRERRAVNKNIPLNLESSSSFITVLCLQ